MLISVCDSCGKICDRDKLTKWTISKMSADAAIIMDICPDCGKKYIEDEPVLIKKLLENKRLSQDTVRSWIQNKVPMSELKLDVDILKELSNIYSKYKEIDPENLELLDLVNGLRKAWNKDE